MSLRHPTGLGKTHQFQYLIISPLFCKKITSFLFLAREPSMTVQWKLGLADSSLAENLFLKDNFQKILATIFDF